MTIEDLIVGTAFPEAEQGFNVARMITFLTDLPETVPGVTINRFCGSSMQAIHDAVGRVSMGAGARIHSRRNRVYDADSNDRIQSNAQPKARL